GEGLLLVIDSEREKILAGLGLLHADRRAEDGGLAIGRHHGAIRLAGNFAGFEDEAAPAPHQLFAKHLKHGGFLSLLSLLSRDRHKTAARATQKVVAARAAQKME